MVLHLKGDFVFIVCRVKTNVVLLYDFFSMCCNLYSMVTPLFTPFTYYNTVQSVVKVERLLKFRKNLLVVKLYQTLLRGALSEAKDRQAGKRSF